MKNAGSRHAASGSLDLEHADLFANVRLFAGLDRVTLAGREAARRAKFVNVV